MFSHIFTYTPKKSIIHNLDPRTKMALIFVTIATVTFLNNYLYIVLFCVITASLLVLSGNIRSLFLLMIIIVSGWCFTLILLFLIGNYEKWIMENSKFFLRIFAMVCAGLLLALTTSTNTLFKGMEKLRLPHPLILMLILTCRFISVFMGLGKDVVDALRTRGIALSTISFFKRPSLFFRGIIIPLTVSMVRFSRDTVIALETRAYGNPNGKTSLRDVKFSVADAIFICILLGFSSFLIILEWYPWI